MNKDFKIVSEGVWKFFSEKYGGTEIKRFYRKGMGYGAEIEATLKELQVTMFPEQGNLAHYETPIVKSIYMSKFD